VLRLREVQLTYPPTAAVKRLATPSDLRSRSIFASLRVAISIPVVLSNRMMAVTNMIATMSPASEGSEVHGKLEKMSNFQGSVRVAAD
jgi:hypothetical protein